MSSTGKLWYGVAAITSAVVGAALLYHYYTGKEEEEETPQDKLYEELLDEGLINVKKGPSGDILEHNYMVNLVSFVA